MAIEMPRFSVPVMWQSGLMRPDVELPGTGAVQSPGRELDDDVVLKGSLLAAARSVPVIVALRVGRRLVEPRPHGTADCSGSVIGRIGPAPIRDRD